MHIENTRFTILLSAYILAMPIGLHKSSLSIQKTYFLLHAVQVHNITVTKNYKFTIMKQIPVSIFHIYGSINDTAGALIY